MDISKRIAARMRRLSITEEDILRYERRRVNRRTVVAEISGYELEDFKDLFGSFPPGSSLYVQLHEGYGDSRVVYEMMSPDQPETDEEYAIRVIDVIGDKRATAAAREKREAADKKLYQRLKKKFENTGSC